MGVCGSPLATPLSPTPPQVGYVTRLPRLLLLAYVPCAGSPFCLVLVAMHCYTGMLADCL